MAVKLKIFWYFLQVWQPVFKMTSYGSHLLALLPFVVPSQIAEAWSFWPIQYAKSDGVWLLVSGYKVTVASVFIAHSQIFALKAAIFLMSSRTYKPTCWETEAFDSGCVNELRSRFSTQLAIVWLWSQLDHNTVRSWAWTMKLIHSPESWPSEMVLNNKYLLSQAAKVGESVTQQ